MLKRILFVLMFFAAFWLNSCKNKINEVDYNPNVSCSKDYIRAEDAVFEIVNSFLKGVHDTAVINSGSAYIDACSVWYYADEDSMKFDYGSVNRMCQDDKFRRGHFDVTFDGNVFDEGVTADINTDSLLVDDFPAEAHIQITNLGMINGDMPDYSLKVLSSAIYMSDTNVTNKVSITTDFLMTWEEGWQTPEMHEDDRFMITGTASGFSRNLLDFTVSIQDSLESELDCWWIESGISQITVPSAEFQTGTIDYIAADSCNNEINFYFNGNLFYDQIK